jgi:ribosomal protein L14
VSVCVGDRIVVVVQKQRAATSEGSSATALANKVRRGDIRHAVVVRVKKELQRDDGTVVRFGDNACVLVNKSGDPIGTRMNGQLKWSYSPRTDCLASAWVSLLLTRVYNILTFFYRCCRTGTAQQAVVQDLVVGANARVKSTYP